MAWQIIISRRTGSYHIKCKCFLQNLIVLLKYVKCIIILFLCISQNSFHLKAYLCFVVLHAHIVTFLLKPQGKQSSCGHEGSYFMNKYQKKKKKPETSAQSNKQEKQVISHYWKWPPTSPSLQITLHKLVLPNKNIMPAKIDASQ